MVEQLTLDVDAEHYSKREKLIIKRLREYRTIEADIAVHERLAKGIGLRHQPSITVSPPREDDPWVLAKMHEPLRESEKEIAATIEHYTDADKLKYVATYRVSRKLNETYSDDIDEDYRIRDAADLMSRRHDEYVHLTDTERLAILREEEIADARIALRLLRDRKEIIGLALDLMKQWYPEQHIILWHKYVMDEHWKKVCELAARGGATLTEDEYRLSRRKALKHFDKWAAGLR